MSAILWSAVGGVAGLVVGAAIGGGAALALASARPAPNDGTFAMKEMLYGVPLGALAGLLAGIAWGVSR